MRLRDDPNEWAPPSDELVKLNHKIMGMFGGGNSVSIEIAVSQGTIYTADNLNTIKEITDALYLVPGCIPFAVRSLSTLSSEHYEITNLGAPDETFLITPVMPQFVRSNAEVKQIEAATRTSTPC